MNFPASMNNYSAAHKYRIQAYAYGGAMVALDINEQRLSSGAWLSKLKGATGPLVGLLALCVFLSLSTDTFLSVRNGLNILDQITVLGIMAVGMTFVILIGGIDLSVGSALALAMMVMGWTANVAGLPLPISILMALVAAGLCGAVSGVLITTFRVPPFIA